MLRSRAGLQGRQLHGDCVGYRQNGIGKNYRGLLTPVQTAGEAFFKKVGTLKSIQSLQVPN
jgi:hypothetical protein